MPELNSIDVGLLDKLQQAVDSGQDTDSIISSVQAAKAAEEEAYRASIPNTERAFSSFSTGLAAKVDEKHSKLLQSVLDKQNRLNLAGSGQLLPEEQSVFDAFAQIQNIQAAEAARIENSKSALISDEFLGNEFGEAANIATAIAIQGGTQLLTSLANTVPNISRAINSGSITDEERAANSSRIKKEQQQAAIQNHLNRLGNPEQDTKEQQVIRKQLLERSKDLALTPEEIATTEQTNKASSITSLFNSDNSVAAIVERIEKLDKFLEFTEDMNAKAAALVNTKNSNRAYEQVSETNDKAAKHFEEGNYVEGVATFLGGFADLSIDTPVEALTLFAPAIPTMVGLIVSGGLVQIGLAGDFYTKGVKGFAEENSRSPDTEEQLVILAEAVAYSTIDRIGAKGAANAGKAVTRLQKDLAASGFRKTAIGLKALAIPTGIAGGIAVEGATEGLQNVLEQASVKGFDDVELVEVLNNTTIGLVGGGVFATPNVIKESASVSGKVVGKTIEEGTKLVDKVTENIGEQTDFEGRVNQIITEGLGGLDTAKRDKKIRELIYLNAGLQAESANAETDKTVKALIQQHVELTKKERTGKTNKEHIDSLKEDTTDEQKQESDESIKTLAEDIEKGVKLPLGSVEKIFGSSGYNRGSDKDKKTIRDEIALLRKVDRVSRDIVKGRENFKGLDEHLDDLSNAVVANDAELAQATISDLREFRSNQQEKIAAYQAAKKKSKAEGNKRVPVDYGTTGKNYYEPGKTDNFIKNSLIKDLKAIEATLNKATSVFKSNFKYDPITSLNEATNKSAPVTQPTTSDTTQEVDNTESPFIEDSVSTAPQESINNELNPPPLLDQDIDSQSQVDNDNTPSSDTSDTVTKAQPKETVSDTKKTKTTKKSTTNKSKPLTVFDKTVADISKNLKALGDKDNKLNKEFEVERGKFQKRLSEVKTKEELTNIFKEIKAFKARVRKAPDEKVTNKKSTKETTVEEPVTTKSSTVKNEVIDESIKDTSGSKGSHQKTLTENLLSSTRNSKSLVNKVARNFTKGIGNVAGATASTLFKSKGNPTGFFNIVHNFFSRYEKSGFTKAMQNKVGKITKEEKVILDNLTKFNTSFSKVLESLNIFVQNKDVFPENKVALSSFDQNPIGYLVKESADGKRYLPENVIGLMSTVSYNWLGTRARNTLTNLDAAINSILGRESDTPISPPEYETFSYIGTSRSALAESLGNEVVKQLGLGVNKDIDGNMVDRLAMSIGLHMLATMEKEGYIEHHSITAKEFGKFKGENPDIVEGALVTFIRLKNHKDNIDKAPDNVNEIVDSLTGSADFLERLFNINSFERLPSTVPIKKVAKFLKGSSQEVSNKLRNAVSNMQSVKWGVKSNVHNVVTNLDRQTLLNMAGWKDLETTKIHKKNIASVKSKNLSIERDIDNYLKAINILGVDNDMYFPYEVISSTRIHLAGNMINPQASKITRHLIGAKSWEVSVPVDNTNIRNNFKLAVAQAFGHKIDTTSLDKSIKAFDDLLLNEGILKGIEAIKTLSDSQATLEAKNLAQESLEAAIAVGRQNFHSLEGLVALSEYKADQEFTTNIGIEVDGVTNGVAIALMQSGLEPDMQGLLASTGVYLNETEGANYPDWKDSRTNLDLYQRLTHHWVNFLTALKNESGVANTNRINAIEKLIGKFVDEDGVTDLARTMSKVPLMVTTYGAAVTNAVKHLGNKFIKNMYVRLEESTSVGQTRQIVADVYAVAGIDEKNIPKNIDYSKPLEISFDKIEAGIRQGIKVTYGETLKIALRIQFSEFFRFREGINTMLNIMGIIFKNKYEKAIKEAESTNAKKLSQEEKLEIYNSLREYLPTFFGPTSTSLLDSLSVIKTKQIRNFKDKKDRVQTNFVGLPSTSGVISHTEYEEPGVGGFPVGTHAQDSAMQLPMLTNEDVLNVFDAHINSIENIDKTTQSVNKAFWDTGNNYSILESINNSYSRVLNLVKDDVEIHKLIDKYFDEFTFENISQIEHFNSELGVLLIDVKAGRKKIFTSKNVQVNNTASGVDGVHVANESVEDKGIKALVEESLDEALSELFTAEETPQDTVLLEGNDTTQLTETEKIVSSKKVKQASIKTQSNTTEKNSRKVNEQGDLDVKATFEALRNKNRNKPRGSSLEPIDFDNFTSRYDSVLTADNSLQIFEDMEGFGNKQENPSHKAHLKEVLRNIVNTVLTASDSVEFRVGDTDKTTHGASQGEKVYINASEANRLNNNSEMSVQETQVHELLHTTLSYVIDNNFHVRKELIKLFNQVAKHVTYEDFLHKVNGKIVYQVDKKSEIAAAKARYNYIFNNKDPLDNAYLHEFVSFGLTNEIFLKKLSTIKSIERKTPVGNSLLARLKVWYVNALDWLSGKFYKTSNVSADVALRNLANNMAGIHSKRRTQALRVLNARRDINDIASKQLNDKILEPFVQWRNSKLNKPNSHVGKTLNAIALIPETYRSSETRKNIKKVLRNIGLTEENMLVKLVREIQGNKSSNAKWHVLLRHSKHVIDTARKHLSNEIVKQIRKDFVAGTPNKEESKAITRALLKTDLSVLVGKYSIGEILGLLRDETKLQKAINSTIKELNVFGTNTNYYINQARGLGNMISRTTHFQDNQMRNAFAIANLTTTGKTVIGDVAVAEEIIDRLASLYALKETEQSQKTLLTNVMKREYETNDADNGIITLFNLQRGFQKDALDQLFNGNKVAMRKGYTSETFNPYTDIKIGTLDQEEELNKSGFVRGERLGIDDADPNKTAKFIYISKNNVGATYVKSIASLTSRSVQGSTLIDGYRTTGSGTPTSDGIQARNQIIEDKKSLIERQFNNPNVTASSSNTLVPILNEQGEIAGYRYMMTDSQKVSLLERDDRFDIVMGNMWGSVTDKVNSKEVNRKVIELAYEDYSEGFTEDPEAYVRIAIDSPETRYSELFSLLPEEVRRDMKDVWGNKEIYVRRELTDLIFGYRKATISNLFKDSKIPAFEKINEFLNRDQVKHIEAIWQEIVKVAKTNIVIRNPAVLMGNFVSNLALSWVKGVPIGYMVKNQALALRALNSYQKDISKRDSLQRELSIDKQLSKSKRMSKTRRNNLEVQLARVTNDVDVNPIKPLVDEGIFQSIIEDIDNADSIYNYRDKFLANKKIKRISNAIPDIGKELGRQAIMTEDTTSFQVFLKATQYSDFIARFALHKHNTEVKKIPVDKSLQDVIDTFINYDIPTSKQMQYMNDVGLFMFSKFLFRIQKVIFTILKERPASTLAVMMLQSVFGDFSDIVDSNLITGSLVGRVNFVLGPLDSATDLKGLENLAEIIGYN